MDNIQIFKFDSSSIRTLKINNEPWFVAKDVCDALDLTNPSMAVGTLDDDERSKLNLGRQGETNIVNESGLYSLILGSRKPSAKRFKRWVTHEVLPAIRKHGAYATETKIEEMLKNPDTMIKTLLALKEEQAKRQSIEQQLVAVAPKVAFADAVSVSNDAILIRDLAKILNQNGVNTGQNRLYAWLKENGYITKKNTPTQKSMDLGLFKVKERVINDPSYESSRITLTTMVLPKGQQYFINKFLEV